MVAYGRDLHPSGSMASQVAIVAVVVVVPNPHALDDYMLYFGYARHIICGSGKENSLRPISAHDFFWC